MRFGSLCCGVGGGLLAFVIAVAALTVGGGGATALWLLAAGLIAMFAGAIVEDATVPAAAMMALAAAAAVVSVIGVGIPALAPAMMLAVGAFLAWSAEMRPRRNYYNSRVMPRVPRPARVRMPRQRYGDSRGMLERLDRLMQMADATRPQSAPLVRRRSARGRLRLY